MYAYKICTGDVQIRVRCSVFSYLTEKEPETNISESLTRQVLSGINLR